MELLQSSLGHWNDLYQYKAKRNKEQTVYIIFEMYFKYTMHSDISNIINPHRAELRLS